MNKKHLFITLLAGLLVVLALVLLPSNDKSVLAQTASGGNGEMRGFAWSSNIGWVSFNSVDLPNSIATYSVKINADNTLEGYAWSSNLGWLRFNPAYAGPTGASDAWGAKIDGNKLTGWARFCSVYVSGCSGATKDVNGTELGGWDGWLKMSDVNYNSTTGEFSGYGWGSLNVGWLRFSYPNILTTEVCCNSIDDNGNGSTDEGCVCGGPGGGPSVVCKVMPSTGNVGDQFTWYIASLSGFAENSEDLTYSWAGENLSSAGSWNPATGRNENIVSYTNSGRKTGSVTVTDGSGNTATDSSCSNDNGQDGINITECTEEDGVATQEMPCCSPFVPNDQGVCELPVGDCQLNLISSLPWIKYYNDGRSVGMIQVAVSGDCDGNSSFSASSELNNSFQLVCSSDGVSFSSEQCSNVGNGATVYVWVAPVGTLPRKGITKNLFNLDYGQLSLRLRFDYVIVAGT